MSNKDILFYLMILVIVGLSIYMIYWTNTNGEKCVASPIQYGIQHIVSSDKSPITCTCSTPSVPISMIFTEHNITYSDYSSMNINFSNK